MACSEWSLSRSLWKKVRQLEKSTPAVLVALVTNYSYDSHTSNLGLILEILMFVLLRNINISGAS